MFLIPRSNPLSGPTYLIIRNKLDRPVATIIFIVFLFLSLFSVQTATAQDKILRFATVEWEPFWGPNLKDDGFFTSIVRTAFTRCNIEFQLDYRPWKRALMEASKNIYDGVMGAYYSEERNEAFYYSSNIYDSQVVLVSYKRKIPDYQQINDLEGLSVGMIRGFIYSPEFDAATSFNKLEFDMLKTGIRMLENGIIDLMAENYNVMRAEAKKLGLDLNEIRMVKPELALKSMHLIMPRDDSNAAASLHCFDKALNQMKEDGKYDQILRNYGIGR